MNRSAFLRFGLLAAGIGWLPPSGALAIDASATGLNINSFLGADAFYNAGFTGTRAIVANVEGGWVWNGQESLTKVSTYFTDPSISGQFDKHATWVGSAIAGQETAGGANKQKGIAPDATLWSGAFATSWSNPDGTGYALSFNFTPESVLGAYQIAMQGGVGGSTADVISSSWGTTAGVNGDFYMSIGLDALVANTGKLLVVSAGNSGPNKNTVYAPASGLNDLAVGSVGSDTSTPVYGTVSSFSSRGPNDFFVPTSPSGALGNVLTSVRASVDLVAPGEDLTLAFYGGLTGGNIAGSNNLASNQYTTGLNGTSFSAPIVAGGAALIVDAGKAMFPTHPQAVDGRVLKAILMNSADQQLGYNNGQTRTGVITTTQALDYRSGAGRMDLAKAFTQYTTGTDDLPGLNGGNVADVGWDYGRVEQGTPQNYLLNNTLVSGTVLTATLDWFAIDQQANNNYGSFDNLYLEVWTNNNGQPGSLVAESIALYNTVQHLSFALPAGGQYIIQVDWAQSQWNFIQSPSADDYALAWSTTSPVPEPAATGIFMGIGVIALRRRTPRHARTN